MTNPKWKEAMLEEIRALTKNQTWELVPLPSKKCAVDCKWVYTVKQILKDTIDRYKPRLMAKKVMHRHMASIMRRSLLW